MQMGGADQWGNITAGLELIRRTASGAEGAAQGSAGGRTDAEADPGGNAPAFGLAYPLLLTASGAKYGKSAEGESIWLDPERTTPFAFYQHWLTTDDRDVGIYLRWFTTMTPDEILGLEADMAERPGARAAQRALAVDVTARTHGAETARQVQLDSAVLFDSEPIRDPVVLERLWRSVGGFTVEPGAASAGIAAALGSAGVFASNGEARRMIQNGGLTINGEPIRDPAAAMPAPINGGWWEVRIGKRRREIGRLGR